MAINSESGPGPSLLFFFTIHYSPPHASPGPKTFSMALPPVHQNGKAQSIFFVTPKVYRLGLSIQGKGGYSRSLVGTTMYIKLLYSHFVPSTAQYNCGFCPQKGDKLPVGQGLKLNCSDQYITVTYH